MRSPSVVGQDAPLTTTLAQASGFLRAGMQRQLRSISPTQLRTYDTCPLQYRMRYLDRVPTTDSPASLVGQAVHAALERNFLEKRHSGYDLDVDEASEIYDDVWASRLPPGAASGASADDFEEAYASGQAVLELYLTEVAPRVIPHLIEHRFRFDIPGVQVQLVGTVDLIDRNGVVIDHKTSWRAYPESYPDQDLQLQCYAIGYGVFRAGSRIRPGNLPAPFFIPEVRVDVLVREDRPFIQQLTATYDREDLDRFAARATDIVVGIETARFDPFWQAPNRAEDPQVCRRCSYARICDASLVRDALLEDGRQDGNQEEQR